MPSSFLRPAPKAGDGINRVVSAGDTLRRVRAFASRCGVTRLADITGLDRLGIPTYSSVVPKSGDFLSVYNGKGSTRVDAMAGALMEAIERQLALNARPPLITASYDELGASAVNPVDVCHALRPGYHNGMKTEWMLGTDLLSGEPLYVPAKLAGYLWRHVEHPGPYQHSSTHGLAAGNCREEAVAHALCELIERDAWTMAELKSHWLPWARTEAAHGLEAARSGWDDLESYPRLDLQGIGGSVPGLLRRFERAELPLLVRDITSDLGVPTIMATAAEDNVPGFPQAHFGLGTHLDVRVAVARALAELAQSRCVDIQGVREDIAQPQGTASGMILHTRRVERIDRRSWINAPSVSLRPWRAVPSCWTGDLLDDIQVMLQRIAGAGVKQVAMVDFSCPGEGIHVVRVVAPGLECYAVDHGRIGERAAQFWRQNVA